MPSLDRKRRERERWEWVGTTDVAGVHKKCIALSVN